MGSGVKVRELCSGEGFRARSPSTRDGSSPDFPIRRLALVLKSFRVAQRKDTSEARRIFSPFPCSSMGGKWVAGLVLISVMSFKVEL